MKLYGTVDFEQLVSGNELLETIDALWRTAGYRRAEARGWVDGERYYSMTLTWRLDQEGTQRIATYSIKRLRPR